MYSVGLPWGEPRKTAAPGGEGWSGVTAHLSHHHWLLPLLWPASGHFHVAPGCVRAPKVWLPVHPLEPQGCSIHQRMRYPNPRIPLAYGRLGSACV